MPILSDVSAFSSPGVHRLPRSRECRDEGVGMTCEGWHTGYLLSMSLQAIVRGGVTIILTFPDIFGRLRLSLLR